MIRLPRATFALRLPFATLSAHARPEMMEGVLKRAYESQQWKDHARKYYYEDRYLSCTKYLKFLHERVAKYKESFARSARLESLKSEVLLSWQASGKGCRAWPR
jgi:hypothetical protein